MEGIEMREKLLSLDEQDRLAQKLWRACQHNAFFHRVADEEDQCGGGAFDGACLAVAEALQRLLGGELCAVRSDRGVEEHVLLRVGEVFWDGFGRQEWQTLVTNWQCFEQKTLVGWRDMEFGHITYQRYQNGMGGYAQWRDVHAPYSVISDLEVYFSEVARGLRLSDTPLRYFVVVCPTFGRKWAFTANNPKQAQLIMDGWNRYQSYHTRDCAHTIVEETEEYLEVAIHNEYTIYARNQL
jgi:hypothetical protein